jgi:hypothetical protein
MVARDVAETAYIHPPQGAYRVTSSAADGSATYPDDGRGLKTTTAGNAHWTDMGLTAGTFEVLVSHITIPTGGFATLLETKAGGTSQIFPAGTHPMDPPIRFMDGFAFTTNAGATIIYRIHEYRQPTT